MAVIPGVLLSQPAGAATASPAYFTYQAPGGASTQGQKVIALTFDDGPGPYTPQVLALLQQYHVPATFFDIGIQVAGYPQYARQTVAAGYPVENHTWNHPNMALLSASQLQYQVESTQQEIQAVTGATPSCIRPPYDSWNYGVLAQDAADGLTTMSYSIDPRDWALPGTSAIVSRVVGAAFPGAVVDLHDAGGDRSQTVAALPSIITSLRSQGYTFVSICNQLPPPPPVAPPPQISSVNSFGIAPPVGPPVMSATSFVGAAATVSGYWMAASNGGVFALGAPFFGSMGGRTLAAPVTAMAATAAGDGYWLATRDGGVFGFGHAQFHGSLGGHSPASPVVGMATDTATGGYWLVTAAGGIFSFGAPFEGSMANQPFNGPVVGMAASPTGNGYWLVTAHGAVFSFGDARYSGSMGGQTLSSPIVGIAADRVTSGYWLAAAKGGVFNFGAPFYGSMGGREGNNNVFAIATTPAGTGYLLTAAHPSS